MSPISTNDLDKITAAITSSMTAGFAQITQALAQQPKAAIPAQAYQYIKTSPFLPKGSKMAATDLASKDARIVAAFSKRGFKVTLMDRNDPAKPFDVRPFKGWLDQGRIVRKGQKGVKGLFHVDQTDPIAKPKAKAKKS
jgi:hypothetical protein